MELQQLRYFVAVAETGKFTTAARDLQVAQPSVSKQVRKLETELGAVLLERRKAGILLTDAGAILLPWAKRVLADLDGARSEVAGLATLERGRLSVGATAEPQHRPPSARARRVPCGASGRDAERGRGRLARSRRSPRGR